MSQSGKQPACKCKEVAVWVLSRIHPVIGEAVGKIVRSVWKGFGAA